MNMLSLILIFTILINGCKGNCSPGANGCATCVSIFTNCAIC